MSPTEEGIEASLAPRVKDNLLCYCDGMGPEGRGISHDEFRIGAWNNPQMAYEELCTKFNIGRRCTACLLNIESAFWEARTSRPADYSPTPLVEGIKPGDAAPPERIGAKRTLYRWIDRIFPTMPTTRLHIAPVVAAKGLSTVLTLSNRFPESIGSMSATHRYSVDIHDSEGKLVRRERLTIAPGDRREIEVSTGVRNGQEDKEIVVGSCWVYQRPINAGSAGSTRPHFKLVGRRGISALHTQVTNTPVKTQVLPVSADGSRYFIHVTNTNAHPISFTVTAEPMTGAPDGKSVVTNLSKKGSALVEVPGLDRALNGGDKFFLLTLASKHRRRAHIFIADADLTYMSADHF